MQVAILCGGQGTRLREYTESVPKPMVKVGGRPVLWHIMKAYAHFDMTEFILCLGYKGHIIKEYFLNYCSMNSDFTVRLGAASDVAYHSATHEEDNWRVTLADTGETTMTGSRVLRASKYLSDESTFGVTYGDGVSDVDIREVLEFHRREGRLATMTGVQPPSRFGVIEHDGPRVTSFSEKPRVERGLVSGASSCSSADSSKPNGQPRRNLDVSRARRLFGWEAGVPLKEGLRRTVAWYLKEGRAMWPGR